jgi:hypothetical protein
LKPTDECVHEGLSKLPVGLESIVDVEGNGLAPTETAGRPSSTAFSLLRSYERPRETDPSRIKDDVTVVGAGRYPTLGVIRKRITDPDG